MNTKITIIITILCVFVILLPSNLIAKKIFNSHNKTEPYIYHDYETMITLLQDLKTNYSSFLSVDSIGKTHEDRDLWMVKLSDNVLENEDEPGVLLLGAHHGNEKPSFEVLIYFIKYVTENYYKENTDDDLDGKLNEDDIDGFDNDNDTLIDEDPSEDRVRDIVNNTQIFLVPMVNPDGVEFGIEGSRKNRVPNHGPLGFDKEITTYGVNLNRNYCYDWIYYYLFLFSYNLFFYMADGSFNYRGPKAFSENETKAIKSFVETHDIDISISYHSYSEVMFYPWYHTSKKAPDEDLFISIGENMSKINKYYLWKGSNYIVPRLGGTLGTVENWLYGKFKIIAFTIELCKTRAPTDPNVVYDTCLKNTGIDLYICERALDLK